MYEMMIKSVGNYFAEGKDITKLLTKELESMSIYNNSEKPVNDQINWICKL